MSFISPDIVITCIIVVFISSDIIEAFIKVSFISVSQTLFLKQKHLFYV